MSPQEKRSLSHLMLAMFFGACMSVCVTPYILTTILREYNASVFQIALIQVILPAGGLLAFPAAIAFSNFNRKNTCIFLHSAGRTFLIVFLVVLVHPHISKRSIPAILLSAYALMHMLGMSATGPTLSWFKEIIPQDIQATFLGKAKGSSVIEKRKMERILQEVKSIWKNRDNRNAAIIPVIANIGTFLVIPFMILLYYDLGLDKFKVGIIVALSAAGSASGLIVGGRFSDRLLVRKVFVFSSLLRVLCHFSFFILTVRTFSSGLHWMYLFGVLAVTALLATFSQSCIMSSSTKYIFNTVKDGSSISFAFITFLGNLVTSIILVSAAKSGAFLSSKADILSQYLWSGFHYTQILFLCSIILSLFCCIYLWRKDVSLS